MTRILTLCVLASLLGMTACEKAEDKPMATGTAATPGPGMATPPADDDAAERARIRRPPPATMGGFNADKNNPNGVPGPTSGVGTSPNRF